MVDWDFLIGQELLSWTPCPIRVQVCNNRPPLLQSSPLFSCDRDWWWFSLQVHARLRSRQTPQRRWWRFRNEKGTLSLSKELSSKLCLWILHKMFDKVERNQQKVRPRKEYWTVWSEVFHPSQWGCKQYDQIGSLRLGHNAGIPSINTFSNVSL